MEVCNALITIHLTAPDAHFDNAFCTVMIETKHQAIKRPYTYLHASAGYWFVTYAD